MIKLSPAAYLQTHVDNSLSLLLLLFCFFFIVTETGEMYKAQQQWVEGSTHVPEGKISVNHDSGEEGATH